MQPVGLTEEQTPALWHGLRAVQPVVQGGNLTTFRVATLKGLFELLRVAEQDEAPAGSSGSEHVGQRHLAGFVNHQHVDALLELGARPAPGRPA